MKAKEVAMIVAISILSALFIGLLVDAIYASPEYDDYCEERFREAPKPYRESAQECTFQLPQSEQDAIDACYKEKGQPTFDYDTKGCQTSFKECDYCNKEYQEARNMYNRNLFFLIAPIALLFIIGGLYWKTEVIGTGFMFSGILLLIYATMRYFSDMSKVLRVVVIGIELLLLLFISKKKLKK